MKYGFFLGMLLICACTEQEADSSFDASVANPAFTANPLKILFDEAHNNFHTTTGRYGPFCKLMANDGCAITANKEPFTRERLAGYSVLVIANAKGAENKYDPAFTEAECEVVKQWVEDGGSLLLIADHYPMGSAAQNLASRFGVQMSNGYVGDSVYYEDSEKFKDQLVFSRSNGLLGDHPISNGRYASERIEKIVTFTGQSLNGPETGFSILKLSPNAFEAIPDSIWIEGSGFFAKTYTRFSDELKPKGNSQAVALQFGKGRVVILGEAAMITAQISGKHKFGMNVSGNDNRQFALNIMHWLATLI